MVLHIGLEDASVRGRASLVLQRRNWPRFHWGKGNCRKESGGSVFVFLSVLIPADSSYRANCFNILNQKKKSVLSCCTTVLRKKHLWRPPEQLMELSVSTPYEPVRHKEKS